MSSSYWVYQERSKGFTVSKGKVMATKKTFFKLKKELFEIATPEQLRILKISIDREMERRIAEEEAKYFNSKRFK